MYRRKLLFYVHYSYTSVSEAIEDAYALVGVFIVMMIYLLVILIPSLALCVRRLHDTGKSGWFFFISFIPLVGAILLLVFLATDSQPGPNQYGPNPKGM